MSDLGLYATDSAQLDDTDNVDGEEVKLSAPLPFYQVRSVTPEALARLIRWSDINTSTNIANELTDEVLSTIGYDCIEGYGLDEVSRGDWLKETKEAMDLALQKAQPKSTPWEGSSNVIYPLITQASTQFASRAYPAIVGGRSVVKSAVIGDDQGEMKMDPNGEPVVDATTQKPVWAVEPGAKAARAARISEHMSYQLLEEMDEWDGETDTLLNVLSIVGCQFRKTYYDPVMRRPVSVRVDAKNLCINYWAKSLSTAPRLSEILFLYPYEVRERVADGRFIEGAYTEAAMTGDKEALIEFVEQHCRVDLDGDGYPEPYIVTLHKDSMRVARITARFEQSSINYDVNLNTILSIKPIQYYTKYDFMPNLEGGIYGQGWAQYLRNINLVINTTLNMLMDAGTLQNMGGGFVGKGMSISAGTLRFKPGEYKMVNTPGQSIKDNVVPLRFDGPSQALMALLTMLIESGKDIAAIKDILTGDLKAQTMSPTVFTAIVEQGLKVYTAIHKRVFRACKDELEKIYRLNRLYLPARAEYQPKSGQMKLAFREDYEKGNGVEPYADPSMVVESQRLARAQVLAEFKDDPSFNGMEIRKYLLEAASIPGPEKFLSGEPAPNPDLMIATSKLEIDNRLADAQVKLLEAQTFKNLAEAIKVMADADATVTQPFQLYAQQQLEILKQNAAAYSKQQPGGSAGSNLADQPPTDAGAPPPPRNASDPALSPGLA